MPNDIGGRNYRRAIVAALTRLVKEYLHSVAINYAGLCSDEKRKRAADVKFARASPALVRRALLLFGFITVLEIAFRMRRDAVAIHCPGDREQFYPT